jgi:hypothetical protein
MASMYGEIIEAKKAIMLAVENSEKDYRVISHGEQDEWEVRHPIAHGSICLESLL